MGLVYFYAAAAAGQARRWFQLPDSTLAILGDSKVAYPPRFSQLGEGFSLHAGGAPYLTLEAFSELAPPGNGGVFQLNGPASPLGEILASAPFLALSRPVIAKIADRRWASGDLYGGEAGALLAVIEDRAAREKEKREALSLHSRTSRFAGGGYPALPLAAIRFLEGGAVLGLGPGELPFPSLAALLEEFPLYPSELDLVRLALPKDSDRGERFLEVAARELLTSPPSVRPLLTRRADMVLIPSQDLEAFLVWASSLPSAWTWDEARGGFPLLWNHWEG